MDVRTIQKSPASLGILSKISYALFGVFLNSIFFAISIKLISNSFGILLGFAISITAIYYGLKLSPHSSPIRLIIWGVVGTTGIIIITTIIFIVGVLLMPNDLESF